MATDSRTGASGFLNMDLALAPALDSECTRSDSESTPSPRNIMDDLTLQPKLLECGFVVLLVLVLLEVVG